MSSSFCSRVMYGHGPMKLCVSMFFKVGEIMGTPREIMGTPMKLCVSILFKV